MRIAAVRAEGVVSLLLALAATACLRPPSDTPRPAPPFELPDLAGGTLSSASLRGKVIVLDFWATWCGPCIKEIPEYAAFWQKNRSRGVEVVGVVVESGEPQDVLDFVREHRIAYRQLVGNEKVQEAFGANQGLPTTFVIDAKGMIQTKFLGSPPTKFERLQKAVDAALAASS